MAAALSWLGHVTIGSVVVVVVDEVVVEIAVVVVPEVDTEVVVPASVVVLVVEECGDDAATGPESARAVRAPTRTTIPEMLQSGAGREFITAAQ